MSAPSRTKRRASVVVKPWPGRHSAPVSQGGKSNVRPFFSQVSPSQAAIAGTGPTGAHDDRDCEPVRTDSHDFTHRAVPDGDGQTLEHGLLEQPGHAVCADL